MNTYVPVQICDSMKNLGNDYFVYGRAYRLRISFMDGHWRSWIVTYMDSRFFLFGWLTSESFHQWKVHKQRFEGCWDSLLDFLTSSIQSCRRFKGNEVRTSGSLLSYQIVKEEVLPKRPEHQEWFWGFKRVIKCYSKKELSRSSCPGPAF